MPFERPVLLYGAGREARSTSRFIAETAPNAQVYVTADGGKVEIEGAAFVTPEETADAIAAGKFGMIVKSPGVPLYKPVFAAARHTGVPVTSNLNLWAAHFRAGRTVIAITGTKGKSTTATLLHLMLTRSGVHAGLAGNVGVAPLDMRDRYPVIVLELSSYQTADMDFEPDLAAITSLYPEHVDWHGSVERYYADKLNLIRHRSGSMQVALSPQAHGEKHVRAALHHDTRRIMVLEPLVDDAMASAVGKSRLKGAHNLENARLAARLALAAGGTLDGVLAGIADFTPLPHRLQEHRIGGLTFVDDSISTTPEATKAALDAYADKRIALIAGGHERQQDYAGLVEHMRKFSIKVLVCLPVTGARLASAVRDALPKTRIIEADNLEKGMAELSRHSDGFDTVILSPGAPSYNQFRDFEERGDRFVMLANELFGAGETGHRAP